MYENKPSASVGVERTSRKKRKKLDRLTRDAIAAQEAGMSYGKWKALHPNTPEEDEEPETDEDAGKIKKPAPIALRPNQRLGTCAHCGRPFALGFKQSNKLYCSTDCRIKHGNDVRNDRRKQNKPGRPAVCVICGADFIADCHSRKYCSTECYTEGQRRRNRARYDQYKERLEEAKKNVRK